MARTSKFGESPAVEKKELTFMKKKGAPKALVNEHKEMAMKGTPFGKPKKFATGGEVRGCGAATKGRGFKGMK